MLSIIPVGGAQIEETFGCTVDMPVHSFLGIDDGRVVGAGGLAWGGGRCFLFLRVEEPDPKYALPVIRQAKKLLKVARQLGEHAVYAPRDASFPTSTKLLSLLGFAYSGMEPGDDGQEEEVWRIWLG